ncbi:MAG: type II toxin-antitoxin system prevent-host-death family antitoxin [Anaerolineales bacterium]|nr:type II toxin-antitoxin system prevent-host-death family antitoxin [Anaerolineales bacterium]MCB8940137.1 type II toxin-antitoxin system prevent-host-death family antitoxin [Ardenticatenaceae bacterium]
MQATAKDLRFNVKELLDIVARGEEVIITYRGKPQAKLVPFEDNVDDEVHLFGIWANHAESEDVNAYVESLRKGRYDVD